MTLEEITARLEQAGVALPQVEREDIRSAHEKLLPMLALIRTPVLPPAAEPATIFVAGA